MYMEWKSIIHIPLVWRLFDFSLDGGYSTAWLDLARAGTALYCPPMESDTATFSPNHFYLGMFVSLWYDNETSAVM